LAYRYFLYWRFVWFDMVVHFVAGLSIASFAYFLATFAGEDRAKRRTEFVFWLALSVGILWEIFEFLFLHRLVRISLINSASDVLFDLLGSLAGIGLVYLFNGFKYNNGSNN
jgi:VanZ family protein